MESSLRERDGTERKAHKEYLEHWKDDQFAALQGDPTAEAALDVDRFVTKYFLDSQERPYRTKTEDPMVLRTRRRSHDVLEDVTCRIRGLDVRHYDEHGIGIVGWDAGMNRAIDAEFTHLVASVDDPVRLPTVESNFNVLLFLTKYFGVRFDHDDVVAIPSEKKPTAVVLLSSFNNDRWLCEVAEGKSRFLGGKTIELSNRYIDDEKVPEKKNLGLSDPSGRKFSHIVVGWDPERVAAEVARIETAKRDADEERTTGRSSFIQITKAEEMERWLRLTEPHRQYVAQKQELPGDLTLSDLPGSYIVRWDGEGREYSYPHKASDVLTLDILPNQKRRTGIQQVADGLTASFQFGKLEGTMLLAMSRRDVRVLKAQQPKDDDEYDEEEKEEVSVPEPGPEQEPVTAGTKRKFEYDPEFELRHRRGNAAFAIRKRMRIEETAVAEVEDVPNRVYLQFAYRDVPGYTHDDPENLQIGHLDFFTKSLASGTMMVPAYGSEPQPFTIYKVADEPSTLVAKQPKEWRRFDGKQFGRW
ncbi:hypothetical protein GE09DRAFT_1217514 [Coniochaeta sp. 2T2.1]|nr:hypothetical protein GE09DRAFT_1217514 [Coniochaeta sp. 2T2.1]